ncbi:hypothetical protein ABRZ87_22305 [Vibrio vulnificus]|uniref:hypothetical protein n=1 Tax=Vibrio vulnificus TaxID=672 RepID=UPI0021D82209|nr:hypothetical protein [Vibrio vulnificus]
MKEQYLWPLIGVVLGWLLNTMSASAKLRLENRKSSARLLSQLIQLKSQVSIYLSTSKYLREMSENSADYEQQRIGIINRHFMKPDSFDADLRAAIQDYSSLYPLSASKLEATYQGAIKLNSVQLTSASKMPKMYENLHRTIAFNAKFLEKALDEHIHEAAFHHGLFTYLRVRLTDYTKSLSNVDSIDKQELIDTLGGMEMAKTALKHVTSENRNDS